MEVLKCVMNKKVKIKHDHEKSSSENDEDNYDINRLNLSVPVNESKNDSKLYQLKIRCNHFVTMYNHILNYVK